MAWDHTGRRLGTAAIVDWDDLFLPPDEVARIVRARTGLALEGLGVVPRD